jgi:hypothetical protein
MRAGSMKYPVYVTNTTVIDLLPPQDIDGSLDMLNMLTGKFGDTSFYIQAYLQADENGLFMSLMNDFGTDMGSLSYTGDRLAFDSSVFPSSLKPQYITADIQFTYYNADAVRSVLNQAGLDFVITKKDDGVEVRDVMHGNKCIEEITKSPGVVKIVNYLRGYEYNLTEAQQ